MRNLVSVRLLSNFSSLRKIAFLFAEIDHLIYIIQFLLQFLILLAITTSMREFGFIAYVFKKGLSKLLIMLQYFITQGAGPRLLTLSSVLQILP